MQFVIIYVLCAVVYAIVHVYNLMYVYVHRTLCALEAKNKRKINQIFDRPNEERDSKSNILPTILIDKCVYLECRVKYKNDSMRASAQNVLLIFS